MNGKIYMFVDFLPGGIACFCFVKLSMADIFGPLTVTKEEKRKTRKLIINERLFILSETNWHVRAWKNLKGIMKRIIIKHNVTEVINYKQFFFLFKNLKAKIYFILRCVLR
jgi:hypothetical protein